MKALLAASLFLACAVGVPLTPAHAQIDSREGILLQNQIAELRQELQSLRDQMAKAPASGGSSLGGTYPAAPADGGSQEITTQLLTRVQRLEDEVRSLRGRIDEVDNARQRQAEDLGKQIGDLNFKIDSAGGGAAPAAPGAAPAAGKPTSLSPQPGNLAAQQPGGTDTGADVPPPPPPPPPKRTPEMILQEGNAALQRKDYPAAEAAAKSVLATGGAKATDAQFLLARSLYFKRDFAGAAVAFDDTYNRAKTGAHAQDALLGLASSLNAIAEKRAACQTLDKMAAEFPTPRADLKVPAAALRRDAGCR